MISFIYTWAEAKGARGRNRKSITILNDFILMICGLRHDFSRNVALETIHPSGKNQNETDGNNGDKAEKKLEKISVKILRHT